MSNNTSRVIKGTAQVGILRLTPTGRVPIAVEVPAAFQIANGITETVAQSRSPFGETVRGNIFISENMPELTLTVGSGKDNPFWHELIFGYQYQEATATVPFTEVFFIPPGTGIYERPPATSNTDKRFGLAANANVIGSYMGATTSGGIEKSQVQLVRIDWDADLATIPDNRFMVNTNGQMRFAPNLRGKSVSLTWEIPNVSVIRSSDLPTEYFEIIMEVLDDINYIEIFHFPRVKPNLNGRTYDPTAETWELGFYITPYPGQCKGFQHYYTPRRVVC